MLSSFFARFRSLSRNPKELAPGTAVNQQNHGHVTRFDGVVVASLGQGVLVEWPRGGSSLVPHHEIAVIAA